MDVFSVHELDDVLKEIGYINGEPIYYHFLIPEIEMDYGLLPLGNDSDVILLSKHVANHKEITVYTEHGTTRLHTYFMSPNKVVLEEINGPISLELNLKKVNSTEIGSCSRKLDLNDNYDFSRSVVPFGHFVGDVVKDVGVQPASEKLKKVQDVGVNDYQQMGDNEEIGDVISDETGTIESISDDRDFLVDELNMVEDVEVNMKDFYGGVYSFPNLDNHQSFNAPDVIVDEDLEVIDTQLLNKPTTFSSGVVHKTTFHLGQIFKSSSEVKDYIKMHSSRTRTGGPWTKSIIKCKHKKVSSQKATCPWVVLISRSDEESDWMVKTLVNEHRCVQSRSIKACTSKFLATTILQLVEGNPTIPVKALRVELQKTYEVGMSRIKVFRDKQLAQKHVYGDYQKQYILLRDYVLELQHCNPGTTVKIDVYSSLKLGFKAGLRDFLGFDGAFMKGAYPGQFLTIVGLDSNNGIYPLAYAIVEAETKSSWKCLGEDLELSTNSNFTFISDRKKGILPAISNLFLSAEHRLCLRHIHENMKLQWRGRSTEIIYGNVQQQQEAHTNILLNNLCEFFNSKLLDARDKPIITCLEYIREYLMKRICIVQNVIDKSQGPLTPTTTKLLDGVKKDASQYTCIFSGAKKTQDKNCSFRHWEITRIPCSHLVSAIWDKVEHGAKNFSPLEEWVGRPEKKRKRSYTEEPNNQGKSLTRKFLTITCSKCKNKVHNSRSCKGQGVQNEVRNVVAGARSLARQRSREMARRRNLK
uniref:SWIM-type domain-containing protein n=1 Tax=Lactuca sativa TaxID=4236 RepID=A0A9R1WCR5_LACSA|nr:hypothetical protein LSAT_V11C200063970 [Lactuca sativa]